MMARYLHGPQSILALHFYPHLRIRVLQGEGHRSGGGGGGESTAAAVSPKADCQIGATDETASPPGQTQVRADPQPRTQNLLP